MKFITLEGDRVPALGFGTWMLRGEGCRDAVADAIRIGYRHIDTAEIYGNETEIGWALAESGIPREEFFVTSKIWWDHLRYRDAVKSAEESIQRLGTQYLDLLLIHWPNEEVPLEEPLRALQKLKHDGKARHIGVSNFTLELLGISLRLARLACIQVEYHPLIDQSALVRMTQQNGLMLTAYSPLARGEVEKQPVLQEIGRRYGKTPAQVSLRWLMQQRRVAAIPKASSAEHRRANFQVFDFELSVEEMERIAALGRGRRVVDEAFSPNWGP